MPKNAINPDDYYQIVDVVAKYGKCPLTINSYVKEYNIPPLKFGRTVYLHKKEIDKVFQNAKKRRSRK